MEQNLRNKSQNLFVEGKGSSSQSSRCKINSDIRSGYNFDVIHIIM